MAHGQGRNGLGVAEHPGSNYARQLMQGSSLPSHRPFFSTRAVHVQRTWRREVALVSNHRMTDSDTTRK